MKKIPYIIVLLLSLSCNSKMFAQDAVADNMLLYQRAIGGWPKHINDVKVDYTKKLTEGERAGLADDKFRNDATIDNNATTKEIRYLLKASKSSGNKDYLKAAENGIRYLLLMQQPSGGFPQFYPDSLSYRAQITYNDNAMINALNLLWDVAHKNPDFELADESLRKPSEAAVEKGIGCILKTQVVLNGKLTAWCAQHDRKTFLPVKARAFELVSLSGAETVGIVEFLMKVEKPSPQIKASVIAGVAWLESAKIKGYRYEDVVDKTQPGGKDRVIVPDNNSTIWARFYDMDTNQPFFSGRDSKKKWSVAEIEVERRVGYAWYGTWAAKLLEKEYPKWKLKNGIS